MPHIPLSATMEPHRWIRPILIMGMDYCDDRTGYVCAKSSLSSNANYMLMSAKKNCGNSGHNHMDLLSLCLTFGGQEFIGEPNSRLLYQNVPMGSAHRGYLYNMNSHNTVLAYSRAVQPDEMYATWYGVYRPDSPVSACHSCQDDMYVQAYHDAYTNCRHERNVLFHRQRGILVRDHIIRATRLPYPHIQRWHLFADVSCTQLDEQTVLLEKNGVRVLALWGEEAELHIYPNEFLCHPQFIPEKKDLPLIIDASFSVRKNARPEEREAFQSTLFLTLPANGPSPSQASLNDIRAALKAMPDLDQTTEALRAFPSI